MKRKSITLALAFPLLMLSQEKAEYRAFWLDTFNSRLNNHADVVAVVSQVKASNANAIFAQVRRRGDSWYIKSLEPAPDFTPLETGFDVLQDLIDEAHANAIEVHAFTIVGAIWLLRACRSPAPRLSRPLWAAFL